MVAVCFGLMTATTWWVGAMAAGEKGTGTTVMFWNLENFFDFKDDGTGESDAEFSACRMRWVWRRRRTGLC